MSDVWFLCLTPVFQIWKLSFPSFIHSSDVFFFFSFLPCSIACEILLPDQGVIPALLDSTVQWGRWIKWVKRQVGKISGIYKCPRREKRRGLDGAWGDSNCILEGWSGKTSPRTGLSVWDPKMRVGWLHEKWKKVTSGMENSMCKGRDETQQCGSIKAASVDGAQRMERGWREGMMGRVAEHRSS